MCARISIAYLLATGLAMAAPPASEAVHASPAVEAPAPPPALAVEAPAPVPTPLAPPPGAPLDRFSWAAGAALLINRLLQLLKNYQKLLPSSWKPYLPLVAAFLGLVAGAADMIVTGSPWYVALVTAVVGSSGAVFVREAGRAVSHARAPAAAVEKKGAELTDDELADKISES